ncbi:MAG: hypothetical protein R2761_10790 [Acidimicrobiales bacterium]
MTAAWAFRRRLTEWAVLYANGRIFTCMSSGIEKGRPRFEFSGMSAHDRTVLIQTGTATKGGQRMRLSGLPRLVDDPAAMDLLRRIATGEFNLADWDDEPDYDPDNPPPEPPTYPESPPPPPEYLREWNLATDPIEHAVIYDDGCVVTIWAHSVETTPNHYRFHVMLDDGADVIMGTATRPGAVCLLVGSPALADDAGTEAILAAAYDGDVGPARDRGLRAG